MVTEIHYCPSSSIPQSNTQTNENHPDNVFGESSLFSSSPFFPTAEDGLTGRSGPAVSFNTPKTPVRVVPPAGMEVESPSPLRRKRTPEPQGMEVESPLKRQRRVTAAELEVRDDKARSEYISKYAYVPRPGLNSIVPRLPCIEESLLSDYDSDLCLSLTVDALSATTSSAEEGFALLWGGCRSTVGVTIPDPDDSLYMTAYFEVKITNPVCPPAPKWLAKEAAHTPIKGKSTVPSHLEPIVRVGFSPSFDTLQLGEGSAYSFGYGSTGRKACQGRFEKYGVDASIGSTIGCYLQKRGPGMPLQISFIVDGVDQGVAFEHFGPCPPLFPHILLKNVAVRANFGAKNPTFPLPPGVRFLDNLDTSMLVPSPEPPVHGSVTMMIGLPGSGKTSYINQMMQENPHSRYTILGTNHLLEMMRVTGARKMFNQSPKFETLMNMGSKVFDVLLTRATQRNFPRNYILDQMNLSQKARRQKLVCFAGCYKTAIVKMCSEHELVERQQLEFDSGKELPAEVMNEIKCSIELPSENDFDEILYEEASHDICKMIIANYIKTAPKKLVSNPHPSVKIQYKTKQPFNSPPAAPTPPFQNSAPSFNVPSDGSGPQNPIWYPKHSRKEVSVQPGNIRDVFRPQSHNKYAYY